jgi:hypothetical protein
LSAIPDDAAAGARWPTTRRSQLLLGAGVGAVGVLGLVIGLGVADLTGPHQGAVASTGGGPPAAAAPPAPSAAPSPGSAPGSSTTAAPTTTAPASTSTTAADTSSSSSSSTVTTTASSSSSTTPSTAVATSSVATLPPSTAAPATIEVAFSQDSDGALVVPRNGTATIELTNTGGERGQWSFSLPTPDYTLSQTSGTVDPGQRVTVTVHENKNKPHTATINAVVSPGTRLTVLLETP